MSGFAPTDFQARCFSALLELYDERRPEWITARRVAKRVGSHPTAVGKALNALDYGIGFGRRGPVVSTYLERVDRYAYAPREPAMCAEDVRAWLKTNAGKTEKS